MECKHGQLARSCPLCELETENERLRAALQFIAEMSLDATAREAAQAALDAAGDAE